MTDNTEEAAESEPSKPEPEPIKPDSLDVLEANMLLYHNRVPVLLEKLVNIARGKGDIANALKLVLQLKECAGIASENAAKLAPYRHPKLESIDIRQETEHRFVIRAPAPAIDLADWMKQAGAEMLPPIEEQPKLQAHKTIPDYPIHLREDDNDSDEDDARYYNGS